MNTNFDELLEDEIVSIEPVGYEDTIDIETDGNHLFFANNILTHNSAVSQDDLDHSHIAGGISKINTADLVLGIIATDAMREKGVYELQVLKTRNSSGTGRKVRLKFLSECMTIKDDPEFLANINTYMTSKNPSTTQMSEAEKQYNEIQNTLNESDENYNPVDVETGAVVPSELRNGMGSNRLSKLKQFIDSDDEEWND